MWGWENYSIVFAKINDPYILFCSSRWGFTMKPRLAWNFQAS